MQIQCKAIFKLASLADVCAADAMAGTSAIYAIKDLLQQHSRKALELGFPWCHLSEVVKPMAAAVAALDAHLPHTNSLAGGHTASDCEHT